MPSFSFLEGNNGTKGRNEDEDNFSFSLQSVGMFHLLQIPEGIWDLTNSKMKSSAAPAQKKHHSAVEGC